MLLPWSPAVKCQLRGRARKGGECRGQHRIPGIAGNEVPRMATSGVVVVPTAARVQRQPLEAWGVLLRLKHRPSPGRAAVCLYSSATSGFGLGLVGCEFTPSLCYRTFCCKGLRSMRSNSLSYLGKIPVRWSGRSNSTRIRCGEVGVNSVSWSLWGSPVPK